MAGGSLTELIVRPKEVLAETVPSLTEIEIEQKPEIFVAGVTVKVREVPLPPRIRLLLGTMAVLDEIAETTNALAGVSRSPMVKGIVMGVSSLTV
jgi:hypothetical protein